MGQHNLRAVVRYLRQLAGSPRGDGASDSELLERYLRFGDEAAFELLVWRHGALVFNLCRRMLPCEQDAEDAFQASFLAFVRKAGSISRRGSVASWLYKVAYRVALEARKRAQKTAAREKSGSESLAVQPADDLPWSDVRPILDEELNRLPERLRRPIVLCYLEGKSNAEAALELRCRLGTIYSRLSRGRELLRKRLQRRGVTLPAVALTATLTARTTEAVPAIPLVRTAARAAIAFANSSGSVAISPRAVTLAEGVLRIMFVTKLKIAIGMLLVLGVAAGGVLTQAWTATPPAVAAVEESPKEPADNDKKAGAPIAVKVVKPKENGRQEFFVWNSVTQPAQQQRLFPLVSGTIKEIAVDVGDQVRKGQELIRLDAPLVLNEVEQAKATLEIAQARMEEGKVKDNNTTKLFKDRLISSNEVDVSRAALKAAEANVRLAQAALDRAKIQEGFTHLTAEFDGVVAERNCDPGNLVQGGPNSAEKPLLTLVRVDRLRINMELAPEVAGSLKRGDLVPLSAEGAKAVGLVNTPIDDASALLKGDPKEFIHGKIARISPIVDRPDGRRTVVIEVANPNNRLVPGESIGVQISFKNGRTADSLSVPVQSLITFRGKSYVFIVREGKAQEMLVTVKNKDGQVAEITGIQASDLVVVNNQGELAPDTPIKVELVKDW